MLLIKLIQKQIFLDYFKNNKDNYFPLQFVQFKIKNNIQVFKKLLFNYFFYFKNILKVKIKYKCLNSNIF